MKVFLKTCGLAVLALLLWLAAFTHFFRECEEYDFDLVTSGAIEGSFKAGYWTRRDSEFAALSGGLDEFTFQMGKRVSDTIYKGTFLTDSGTYPCKLTDFMGTAIIEFESVPPFLSKDSLRIDRTCSNHGCSKETLWLSFAPNPDGSTTMFGFSRQE